MTLRLLVAEGNVREAREGYRAGFGKTPSEAYVEALRAVAPDAEFDIVHAADADASAPAALGDYDGVFLTGSALNLYDGGPEVERQVALARATFAWRTPLFGSCWGLQVACAAAGGRVRKNPRGREIGVARDIWPSEAGRAHPLLAGRPAAYEALCSHLDIVELPPSGIVLAESAHTPVQAAEIRHDGGVFWGVQYHPEFSFTEIAMIVARVAPALAREGVATEAEACGLADELRALEEASAPIGLAWRLGLGEAVLTQTARSLELRNFVETCVRPTRAQRGRG